MEPIGENIARIRRRRGLTQEELAERAEQVFGEDRVRRAARLDEAIDLAVALADEGDPLDSGVVVTGSVVTVGEAGILLKAGR